MKKTLSKRVVAAGAVFAAFASMAFGEGTIIGSSPGIIDSNSGLFEILSPSDTNPVDLTKGVTADNIKIFIVDEGVTTIDFGPSTIDYIYTGYGVGSTPLSTPLSGPYTVRSYLFHWDPITSTEGASGSITFNSDVLGFWGSLSDLNKTDPLFGDPNVTYEDGAGRGAGFGNEADSFTIAKGDLYGEGGDEVTIFEFNVGQPDKYLDEFRVLTISAVPEPSTVAMLGLVGFSAVLAGRKRLLKNRKSTV